LPLSQLQSVFPALAVAPAPHDVQAAAPAALIVLPVQSLHVAEPAALAVPAAHVPQVVDPAPLAVPAAHGSHAVAPAFARVPAAHGAQVPPALLTEPAAQGLQDVAPVPLDWPAGHGEQASAPLVLLNVPGSQAAHVGFVLPEPGVTVCWPLAQTQILSSVGPGGVGLPSAKPAQVRRSLHIVWPVSGVNVLVGHAGQAVVRLLAVLAVPAAQS
jgi:hypothetical protein